MLCVLVPVKGIAVGRIRTYAPRGNLISSQKNLFCCILHTHYSPAKFILALFADGGNEPSGHWGELVTTVCVGESGASNEKGRVAKEGMGLP
jgi:hypothetical protein